MTNNNTNKSYNNYSNNNHNYNTNLFRRRATIHIECYLYSTNYIVKHQYNTIDYQTK